MSRNKVINGCSEIKDISPGVSLTVPTELLGRRISLSTQTGSILKLSYVFVFSCRTKIYKSNIAIRLQHYICRLHISVDNRWLSAVKVTEHVTKLLSPFNYVLLRLCSIFLQYAVQRLSFYIVHYYKKCIVSVYNVNNTGKVGMIKPFKHISLNYKSLSYNLKILSSVLADLFNSPRLIGCFVDSKVYDTHTTLPDFIQYFIFTVYYRTYL